MTVGEKDPLRDGVMLMMQRMVEAQVQCQLTYYEGLGHGLIGLGSVLDEG